MRPFYFLACTLLRPCNPLATFFGGWAYMQSKKSIHGFIEVPTEEEGLGGSEEGDHSCGVHQYHRPEGSTIAHELCNHAT